MAESRWSGVGGGGGVVLVEESPGGKACWEGSMAHLTPPCPLLHQAGPLAPLKHSPPGNEVVQLFRMRIHSQMQTTCRDLWMFDKDGWWQNEASQLFNLLYPNFNLRTQNVFNVCLVMSVERQNVDCRKE